MNPVITELVQLLEGACRAQNDLVHDVLLNEFEARYATIDDVKESWKVFRVLRNLYDAALDRDPQAFDEAKREAGLFEEAAV